MIALTLVLSKGRTTWVAWPTLGVRDYEKVQVDYNKVWRGVLRAHMIAGSPHLSDEQILARLDLLMLHLHVESIGCSTFVGYSCMHLRLYLLPFRLSKVQWVLALTDSP